MLCLVVLPVLFVRLCLSGLQQFRSDQSELVEVSCNVVQRVQLLGMNQGNCPVPCLTMAPVNPPLPGRSARSQRLSQVHCLLFLFRWPAGKDQLVLHAETFPEGFSIFRRRNN